MHTEPKQGCGAQIEITVNGKPVVEDMTVISEGCDVEEYLKVGIAAMVVVGDRPTLLQLVRKVGGWVGGWVGGAGETAIARQGGRRCPHQRAVLSRSCGVRLVGVIFFCIQTSAACCAREPSSLAVPATQHLATNSGASLLLALNRNCVGFLCRMREEKGVYVS